MDMKTGKMAAQVLSGDDLVRMYPSNQLKAQVRDPKESLSAFKVLKETFFVEHEAGAASR